MTAIGPWLRFAAMQPCGSHLRSSGRAISVALEANRRRSQFQDREIIRLPSLRVWPARLGQTVGRWTWYMGRNR